jgi:hypothetical protein
VPAAKDSTLGGGKPRFNVNFSNNPKIYGKKEKRETLLDFFPIPRASIRKVLNFHGEFIQFGTNCI